MTRIDPASITAVHPGDMVRCAAHLDELLATSRDIHVVSRRLATEFGWSRAYGLAVASRLLAWGRYLGEARADRTLAPVLTLVAAASVPLSAEPGFEVSLLERSAVGVVGSLVAEGRPS